MAEEYKGYCVRCRDKEGRVMKDVEIVDVKGKGGSTRKAAQGLCTQCGTKMVRFLPKQ